MNTGIEKKEYNHSADSVIEASGYSDETVNKEILPRAMLLGNEIADVAGACPTMVVEVMMDSPILRDQGLDDRDRAIIIVLSGSIAAQGLFKGLIESHGDMQRPGCESKHGYNHAGKSMDEVFNVSRMEMDILSDYIGTNVLNSVTKTSQFVENVERVISDNRLNAFQKAYVEAMVCHHIARIAAQHAGPSVVLDGIADPGNPGAG